MTYNTRLLTHPLTPMSYVILFYQFHSVILKPVIGQLPTCLLGLTALTTLANQQVDRNFIGFFYANKIHVLLFLDYIYILPLKITMFDKLCHSVLTKYFIYYFVVSNEQNNN